MPPLLGDAPGDRRRSGVTAESEVAEAAHLLIKSFGDHDVEAYFASFTPSATFIFHTHPEVVTSRDAYRSLWESWEAEGFRVVSCTSSNQKVTVISDDGAVFTHSVRTVLEGADEELFERETIVFHRDGNRWLGVHEHLSLDPSVR